MQEELIKGFQEPQTSSKVMVSLPLYKVPVDLVSALFRVTKVQEEMTKSVGSTRPLDTIPRAREALETFYE